MICKSGEPFTVLPRQRQNYQVIIISRPSYLVARSFCEWCTSELSSTNSDDRYNFSCIERKKSSATNDFSGTKNLYYYTPYRKTRHPFGPACRIRNAGRRPHRCVQTQPEARPATVVIQKNGYLLFIRRYPVLLFILHNPAKHPWNKTLLFMDEIQECERAILSFCRLY